MKTFRDERHGFEINIPDEWAAPGGEFVGMRMEDNHQFAFQCPPYEAFNIVVGDLKPEDSLEKTRNEFQRYASDKGYNNLHFGEITVLGKQHVWARYLMGPWHWTKKYMIVFVGLEYDFTCTTTNPTMLSECEVVWDRVVTSFRLINPIRDTPEDTYVKQHGKLAGTYYGETEPQPSNVGFHPPKPPASPMVVTIYRRAYDAVTRGRYSAAQALLKECIRLDPEFTLSYKEMAVINTVLGDHETAVKNRVVVRNLDPSDLINRYKLAQGYYELRRWDEALEEAQHLIKDAPNEARYQQLLSLIETQRQF